MSNNTRRSNRQRKPNSRYTEYVLDEEGDVVVNAESSSSPRAVPQQLEASIEDHRSGSDDEYEGDKNFSGSDVSFDEGDDVVQLSDQSPGPSVVQNLDHSFDGNTLDTAADIPGARTKKQKDGTIHETSYHSRGLKTVDRKSARGTIYPEYFGREVEDLAPALYARDTWLKARDVTFPSRLTLIEMLRKSIPYEDWTNDVDSLLENQIVRNTPRLWESYEDRQKLEKIEEFTLRAKYLVNSSLNHSVILDSWTRQGSSSLQYLKALDFGLAWEKRNFFNSNTPKPVNDASTVETSAHTGPVLSDRYREGWLINLGEKPQCLTWASGHSQTQYLAISCRSGSAQRSLTPGIDLQTAPAFRSSSAYASNIQVWAIDTKVSGEHALRTLDMKSDPRLAMVYATDIGDIRQLQWAPESKNPQELEQSQSFETEHIGLLAILSTDGAARFIYVHVISESAVASINGERLYQPARKISPPSHKTIFTAMTFSSTSDIILAASDGSISLYNLNQVSDLEPEITPYMTTQLHSTYIMSICTTLSASVPTYLASSSASGEIRLTDLRNPTQDYVSVHKARIPTKNLFYSPFTRSFITTVDHSGQSDVSVSSQTLVACHNLRHFYNTVQIAKLPQLGGMATALAGSRHHPCILIGNARGTIHATNYLRKMLPTGTRSGGPASNSWLQKLCGYEWRPDPTAQSVNDPVQSSQDQLYHGRDIRPGMSIFQEGFSPEKIDLSTNSATKHRNQAKSKTKNKGRNKTVDGVEQTTDGAEGRGAAEIIFEEEQAVTAIEWNPNPLTAGLVAMAWGSGILRIQDLSHDHE